MRTDIRVGRCGGRISGDSRPSSRRNDVCRDARTLPVIHVGSASLQVIIIWYVEYIQGGQLRSSAI